MYHNMCLNIVQSYKFDSVEVFYTNEYFFKQTPEGSFRKQCGQSNTSTSKHNTKVSVQTLLTLLWHVSNSPSLVLVDLASRRSSFAEMSSGGTDGSAMRRNVDAFLVSDESSPRWSLGDAAHSCVTKQGELGRRSATYREKVDTSLCLVLFLSYDL